MESQDLCCQSLYARRGRTSRRHSLHQRPQRQHVVAHVLCGLADRIGARLWLLASRGLLQQKTLVRPHAGPQILVSVPGVAQPFQVSEEHCLGSHSAPQHQEHKKPSAKCLRFMMVKRLRLRLQEVNISSASAFTNDKP